MPYKVYKEGSKYVVRKHNQWGKVMGKHDSKGEAEAQVRAIEWSEHGGGK